VTLTPGKQLRRHSNLVNEVILNAVQVDHAPNDNTTTITPAIANLVSPDSMFIPNASGTSRLWFRCIDEFTSLMSTESRDVRFTYTTGVAPNVVTHLVPVSQMVFDPVQAEWQGEPWLVPYILSFTTSDSVLREKARTKSRASRNPSRRRTVSPGPT